jgi:S-adenosylmethionine synthetase
LDIVDNTFITLRKGLRIDGVNVVLRDTILLAPAGKNKLSSIGSLYEGGTLIKFNLVKISIATWISC